MKTNEPRVRANVGTWVHLAPVSMDVRGIKPMIGSSTKIPMFHSRNDPPSYLGGIMDSKRWPKVNTQP